MKVSRISASVAALAAISLLAACGGGGGGGSVTPPTGGGGGGTPATPTPVSSSSPAPTTTPTPSTTPTPATSPTPSAVQVNTSLALSAQIGPQVNGTQGWYSAGTTAPWSTDAGDTSAGATGAAAVDGMSCTPTTEPAASTSTYSVHSFVGIYYNGTEYALPTAIGMQGPVEPTQPTTNAPNGHPNDNYEVEASTCEYNVHTHDYSGLVHVEDTGFSQSTSPTAPMPYAPTLQSLLDIWGVQLSSTGLTVPGGTNLSGNVAIYYGTMGTDVGPHGDYMTDKYTQVTNASQVPLGFHDTAWIVIGNMPTGGLPEVEWRVEY